MGTEPMYSNAFALSGRTLSLYIHPGRCPGLCACWAFSPLLERLLSIGGQPFPSKHIARRAPIPATSVQGPPRRSTGGQGAPRRSTGVQGTPRRGNERSRPASKGQRAFKACPEGSTGGRGGSRFPWHSGFPGPFSQKNCFFRKKNV